MPSIADVGCCFGRLEARRTSLRPSSVDSSSAVPVESLRCIVPGDTDAPSLSPLLCCAIMSACAPARMWSTSSIAWRSRAVSCAVASARTARAYACSRPHSSCMRCSESSVRSRETCCRALASFTTRAFSRCTICADDASRDTSAALRSSSRETRTRSCTASLSGACRARFAPSSIASVSASRRSSSDVRAVLVACRSDSSA